MLLTWIYGGKPQIVFEGDVKICQSKRTALKKERQYKDGYFQIRTREGYKAVPILVKKPKKK